MHCAGSGNIDADPLFIDPANGNYSLQACSPAINAGSNSHYSDLDEDTKDLAGNPRVYDFGEGTIDMGPYEFQGEQVNYDDVVFGDETVVYNASAQMIEAEDIPEEAEVSYVLLDAEGDTIAQAVEAGKYTVIAAFTGCGPEEELSAVLTIQPAPLTITVDKGQFKVYGTAEDPEFSFSASGWQGTDDKTILSGSLARQGGEGMGTYAITQGDLDAGLNYEIVFISADFEIRQAVATQLPNCSNFSPAIGGAGTATVSAHDFVTNAGSAIYPIEVTVYDRWGMSLADWPQTFHAAWDTYEWPVCDLLGQTLEFSVSNSMGRCRLGVIELNGAPGPVMESAWRDGDSRPNVGQGKMIVYCGNVPAADTHRPDVHMPCGGTYSGPVAMPDWRDVNACGASDTAEVILRHWEVTGSQGQRTTITDTIIVMRLPKLAPGAFVGTAKDTTYCELHPYKEDGEDIYRFAAWKQPMGIADFEQPYSQMGALSYHIPGYVIEAGLINACNQSQSKYDSYLKYVIMKNPDGTEVTIRDIISGDYMFHPVTGVIARATTTQLGYGILNQIYEGATGLIDAITFGGTSCGSTYTFYNYLFPVIGSEILSENGTYETVTEEWFYNGTGNSPYWFSGGWPSIYGSGDCTTYCDVHGGKALEDKIRVRVPVLIADMDGLPYGEECMEINLSSNVNCGLKIVQDKKDEWVEFQNCVTERSVRSVVTQSCWANGIEYNSCADEDVEVGEDCYVEDYQDNERCCDRVVITLNNIQQMIDNQPPIFEFCYPTTWNQDEVMSSIRAGEQYEKAYDYEKSNYTVYRTSSHECGARVFVPDIKVMDNCSGLESVKAVLHDRAGNFARKVELKLTDTEIVNIGGGDRCTIYTYSHLSDPFYIPFEGCDVEPLEIVYNAFDGCNNSYWSKFIQVRDDIPPTVITDRDVNVTMTKDVEYAKAETYDEGSWDNCAIEKMLVRRTDWVSVVNLCANVKNLNSWKDILVAIGFNPTQVGTAVHGGTVGNPSIDISKLDNFLNTGEIELYYLSQIKKLWGEGGCSEKVVHGWLFDIARALADCDADNDLSATDLEFILDRLFAEAGYGHHVSYIGGGWAEMSPFTCDDACEVVPNELLVIDYCCNVGIGPSETHVIDDSQPRVAKGLQNLTVSCEAYNLFLEDIVAAAAVYEDSDQDSTNAFDALDAALGGYLFVGFDNQGRPVGTDGSLLPDSVLTFEFKNVTCHDRGDGLELKTETEKGDHGIISTTCRGNLRQTVTVKIDECGLGTITRRFWVGSGCNGADAKEIFSQRITIESACPMTKSMFDVPENLGSVKEPVCLPREIATNNLLDTIGELKVKEELLGKLCNSIAIGHKVEVQKLVNYPDCVQYKITWIAVDWCCADDLPEREYEFVQKVIANIDPECTLDEGGDDEDISLVQGTIATEEGDAVGNVEMKAVLGSGSPMTTVTSGDGAYNFSIQDGSNVSLVPSKNTGFANGVTTHDLIYIQRHVLQKELLESKYQRIAADVDGNGRVDAYDVLELRQLVMRPDTELPNNTSWRFFDKNTDKEVYEVSNLSGDVNVDWVGVKIGDVDLSGDATRSSRSTTGELTLTVADKQLKAGETYRVDVTSANFHEVMGMQYTLSYLKDQVDVESIEAGALNITENHYYRYAPGVITSSWSEADAINLSSDEVLFTIVLKAKSAVQLRDVLSLNSRVTPVEAYAADGLKDVSLRFDGAGEDGFALYQNTPNPYAGQTVIGFNLPEASKATLSVYDVTGKMLKVVEGEFNQGYNEVKLAGSDLNATGVLYYQLDTKTYTATKKMIVIE